MDQVEWIAFGVENGYCSLPFCETHDMAPLTPAESEAFEDGWDPCVPMVRLWQEGDFDA